MTSIFCQLKDEYLECVTFDIQMLAQQHIASFVQVITDIGAKIRTGKSGDYGDTDSWIKQTDESGDR